MHQLGWLEGYYLSCCNGDWEHTYGIKIDTLDNPGWVINVDLKDTILELISFKEVKWDNNELDWGHCKITDKVFRGYGGAKNLNDLISVFHKWVEQNTQK